MATHEQIVELVLDRQRMRWQRLTAPRGVLGRLLQLFIGSSDAEGFFVVELDMVDTDTGDCVGTVLQAWRLDRQGLSAVDPANVDPGKVTGRMWPYQMVRMFVSDDNEHVFLNEMEGPKHGMLVYLQPSTSSGQLKLKVVRASPVMGGYAIG